MTNPIETWLPVVDWEGLYEVSDAGEIRSSRRRGTAGKVLRPAVDLDGYRRVLLSRQSVQVNQKVATLVAAAFHGPRPEGLVVRHLDGNNQNDAAANLAYGTKSEDIQDQVRVGTHNNARKTHCTKCGGPYRMRPDGRRYCQNCTTASTRASRQRAASPN